MMAVAMALVVAAGQSGAGFVSGMGSVTKVCAETEDTTEQEYITADGCYTYKILDAEKKTAALTKVDKTKLSVTEVDSQNILTIPSKVDDEYTVTELGDNLFCMVYEVGPVDSQTEDADSNQTGETDSDQTDDTDGDQEGRLSCSVRKEDRSWIMKWCLPSMLPTRKHSMMPVPNGCLDRRLCWRIY